MKGNYTYLTEKFEGATVIEPRRGYFLDPVATLDFASLYPSIMMAHNLCYTTLVDPKDVHKYAKRKIKINKTPNGDYFVDSSVCKGVLPIILEEIVSKRKVVKEQMKVCEDPFDREILDARQQAMKVVANSVYGFTGAHVGMLQCLPISCSVTSYGRHMIELTKSLVQKKYCKTAGFPYDAEVIYGDTDSIMVRFGV